MFKKIIISSVLIILSASILLAGDNSLPSKKGNFSKGNFSKNSTWGNEKSNDRKLLGPPNPGGGGGGNPAPISRGMYIMILGSIVFLTKKIKNELKSHTDEV
jgi:hypothetical protein